ncbi:MAG: pantoate--beta-alanine ligase [Gammaproteobacteria bacterium]|nr:pantoate--beta-alanine ligase [Gammaproteobacteria bacterium]MCK5262456.1 pantoate--beta-alanine ligase [Gammaproteobacteria bacterium]
MSSASDVVKTPLHVRTIDEVRQQIREWKQAGDRIAFVPTMGNLHAGHLSLIEAASKPDTRVVVSIFVNPMQFGEDEDFDKYPRTFDEDVDKLSKYGVDMVFSPVVSEIYPESIENATFVEVPKLSEILEGEHRPGFFKGVATVVNKLFNIVQPDVAVFGEKDYQQLLVIRQMVRDLSMPVEIQSVSIQREPDGLAMSSRNAYLDEENRILATAIQRGLKHLVEAIVAGENPTYEVGHACHELDEQGFVVDYIVVRRQQDLAVPEQGDKSLIVLAAARLGSVRLIDNIPFVLAD